MNKKKLLIYAVDLAVLVIIAFSSHLFWKWHMQVNWDFISAIGGKSTENSFYGVIMTGVAISAMICLWKAVRNSMKFALLPEEGTFTQGLVGTVGFIALCISYGILFLGLRKLSHLNSELSFCNDKEKQILLSFPNRREDFSESFAVLRLGFVGLGYCKTDRGQLALDKYHLHQAA